MIRKVKVCCYVCWYFTENVASVMVDSYMECLSGITDVLFGAFGAGDEIDNVAR